MQRITVHLKSRSTPEIFETNGFGGVYSDGMFLKVVECISRDGEDRTISEWKRTRFYPHTDVERVEVDQA